MARLVWYKWFFICLLLHLAWGCTSPIETKKTPGCVASHVFAWPIRQLYDSIPALFRAEDLRQDDAPALIPLFANYSPGDGAEDWRHQVYFAAETADSTLFGKEYFNHTIGKRGQNIYLHSFGESWPSPTYRAAGKPLAYTTDFAFRLDSISPRQTRVTVATLHPQVYHGYAGIGGMCGLVLLPKEVPVSASRPEECALLAYLLAQLPAQP